MQMHHTLLPADQKMINRCETTGFFGFYLVGTLAA